MSKYEIVPDDERCTVRVPDGGRAVTSHRCYNRAKEDGKCGQHLGAEKRAKQREAKWRAEWDSNQSRKAAAQELIERLGRGRPAYDALRRNGGYTGGVELTRADVLALLEELGR